MSTLLDLNNHPVLTDNEGYLNNIEDWSNALALQLAANEQIILTPLHWEILLFIRQFYLQHQDMPKMRALINHLRQQVDYPQINSAAIHHLFPLGPALQTAKIAGLPKPKRCL